MKFLAKHKREIVGLVSISILYFFLRLIFISRLPIFTDEAIYVRWAQIALRDASWRFISLTDGKQPLFVWAAMILMKFISDPLIASRLVSVISGFFTMLGLWFLSIELFKSKRTAFITSLLYIFYPFAQVLDRMALYDSMVGSFFIWSLYFSVLLVRKTKLDIAYILGFLMGGGILTKSTNFLSIYLLPSMLLLFDWSKSKILNRLFKVGLLFVLAIVISQIIYGILRLSPLFGMVDTKTATFVYPFSEWIKHPFLHFTGNIRSMGEWLFSYLGISYAVLIIASIIFFKKFIKEKVLLFLYFSIPFIALIFFGRAIFPRFIFFMSLPLLCLAALGLSGIISTLTKKYAGKDLAIISFSIVVFMFYPAFVSWQFAYDPVHAGIAKADSIQYINNWTAGWGVKESIDFLQKEAKNKKIFVATEGTFGLMPASLELYLVQNKNITIKGYWPVDDKGLPEEVLKASKEMPTYFIFYQPPHVDIPVNYPLKLLFQVREGDSDYFFRFYQVIEK